jgi:hypothetical protein
MLLTEIVTAKLPASVGMPLMTPFVGLQTNPGGKLVAA